MLSKDRLIRIIEGILSWCVILLPFSIAIAPAPMNVFMGFSIAAFLFKKLLKKERLFKADPVNIPVLIFFVITCLSAFNSVSLFDTLKGGIFRLAQYILIFYILKDEVRDRAHLNKILWALGLGAALASVDGIFQVVTGRDFIRGYEPILNIGLLRAKAAFKDANILGIYLSAIVPVVLGLGLYYFKGIKKVFIFLAGLLVLIGIALTYSRPTLLAVYMVLLFFGLAKKNKALLSFLLIFTLASPFLLPKSVKEWAREVGYNPLRFMCNDDRIAVYLHSLNMIKAHPVIGVGANTFMKSYKKYKTYPEYRGIITLDEMKAHNNYLHMAGEIGLTGLAIFFWFLYCLFKESKNIYRSTSDNYLRMVSLSLTACLIAFLVNGLTESSLYYSAVAVIFWYIAGLSLALKVGAGSNPPLLMRINNILAFRNDRFGEFLLTVPALYALKQNYPAAKLDLVVDRNVLPIAERLPFINRLIVWENRKHGLGEIFRLSAELKKKRYDACLIFNPGKELNLISWLAGIPLRAGYNRKCAFLLNRRIKDKKSEGLKHEVDYNLELLSAVSKLSFPRKRESISLDCLPRLDRGIKPGNDINDIMEYISLDIKDSDFPDARIAEMGLSGNDFIAIHPWSSNPEKEMARDQFRDLCLRLSRETSCRIVVIGGREEAARSSEFCNGLAVIDLTGKTSLLELAGLLKRCGLLVTVDSGPMHLAAALGKTVVAIFRKNPPGVSARRWGPVGEKHIVIENERIEDIKTDEVLNGIRKAFSG